MHYTNVSYTVALTDVYMVQLLSVGEACGKQAQQVPHGERSPRAEQRYWDGTEDAGDQLDKTVRVGRSARPG